MSDTYSSFYWDRTRIWSDVDFTSPGKRFGELRLKYSNNQIALGFIPIPVGVVINDSGPTVLMIGGVHGDEFEGPVALSKFLHEVDVSKIHGRIIVFPTLNFPAVNTASRVSPLDDGNLNRAFPGNADGTPTEMIANFVEKAVMPVCDAVIDLHSGGKAAWFSPCSMAVQNDNKELSEKNLQLAVAFGTKIVWLMGSLNDSRSVNYAALRNKLPMISVELGGGGQTTPETLSIGERGIRNFLQTLQVLDGEPEIRKEPPEYLEIKDPGQHVFSPHRGLFEPSFNPGDLVTAGSSVGYIHHLNEFGRTPTEIKFPIDGVAFVRCHRGLVEHGELLATIGARAKINSRQFPL